MILVTGPLFSGKTDFARTLLPKGADFAESVCTDAQNLAAECTDLTALADELAGRYAVVTVTEVGGGVVPVDPAQRAAREAAGRFQFGSNLRGSAQYRQEICQVLVRRGLLAMEGE